MNIKEFLRITAEQRDDAAQRPLHEKGVRYTDEPQVVDGKTLEPDAVKVFIEQLAIVRDVTRNLIESIMMDAWPRNAAIVDFGIDSQRHYEALYYPIRASEIMPGTLDAALGHGGKLTALTRESPSNPHKDVAFRTSWDVMFGRQKEGAETLRQILGQKNDSPKPEPTKEQDLGHER